MQPHPAWLIALLPMACGCDRCATTGPCFAIAAIAAALVGAALCAIRELRMLATWKPR